jgi:hypothetical protein
MIRMNQNPQVLFVLMQDPLAGTHPVLFHSGESRSRVTPRTGGIKSALFGGDQESATAQ